MTQEQFLNRSLQNLEDPYLREKYYQFLKSQETKTQNGQKLHPSVKQKQSMTKLAQYKSDSMLGQLDNSHNKLDIKINATSREESNKEEESVFQKFVGKTSTMSIDQAIRQFMRRNTKV